MSAKPKVGVWPRQMGQTTRTGMIFANGAPEAGRGGLPERVGCRWVLWLSGQNPDRYGFKFDGLFNPALNRPDLAEMFEIARDEGGAGGGVAHPRLLLETFAEYSGEGVGAAATYRAVCGDSLTSQVPKDRMERFGIIDNPAVDESSEGRGFGIGLRQAVTPRVGPAGVTVDLDDPHEVIRLSFAKTDAGLREIEAFSDDAGVELGGPKATRGEAEFGGEIFGADSSDDSSDESHADGAQGAAMKAIQDGPDDDADPAGGFDLGAGSMLMALLPLLFLL